MKWPVLATLFAAPLALAGALGADLVVRTDGNGDMQMGYKDRSSGESTVIVEEVVIIWVCHGSGSATTTMNTMASVTSAKSAAATKTVRLAFLFLMLLLRNCRSRLEVPQALSTHPSR